MVVWLSIQILKNSLDGIMDRHTGKEIASKIKAIALSVDEVEKVEWVRTRRVGQNLCIDLRVRVSGSYTMRQADQITAQIRKRLALKMKGVSYVTVDCYPV
jgi:divalent metal cation (Fe/Co/Zn/Cd) transporter